MRALATLLCTLSLFISNANSEVIVPPGTDFSSVDKIVTEALPIFHDKVYIAIMQGDQLIYEYSAGGADENTIFNMASATKWISGGVVLALADRNYISLDDKVGTYLPLFDYKGKGHFTIRDGFAMQSGLFDNSRPHTNKNMTLEQSVNYIGMNTELIFPIPGSAVAYDGKQMQVVGRVAEIATGKDWRTIAQEQLFNKCGMLNSQYNVFGDKNPAVAGGLSTTASDYLKFLKMVMSGGFCNGKRILSRKSIQEMFTNQSNNAEVLETPWSFNHPDFPYGNDALRYGLGAWVLAQNPNTGIVEELSSPGAWGSLPWADRRRGLYGVVFTNIPNTVDEQGNYLGGFKQAEDTHLAILKEIKRIVDSTK